MILLDTNTVIYLYEGRLKDSVVDRLQNVALDTCNIVIAEVLGYEYIGSEEATYYKQFFATMRNHAFDKEVTDKAIELRQTITIKLPDAIIAATALVHDLVLWTHNTDDFKNIPKLQLFDPILG